MSSRILIVLCTFVLAVFGVAVAGAADKADAEKELKKFQGTWTFESQEMGGQPAPADQIKGITITFDGDKFTVKRGDEVLQAGTQKVDLSKKPKTVDATITEGQGKGTTMLGIYELDGDTMKACFDPDGKQRPTEFKTAAGTNTMLVVTKRAKK